MDELSVQDPGSPVRFLPTDAGRGVQPGIALCLSGGGYRAMLFHLGTLWRLNELGYLPKLDRISSVSGGSITAGLLGLKWNALAFDANGVAQAFVHEVVDPIRALAGTTIDTHDIAKGVFLPGTIADYVARSYRDHLFGDATLQDLPDSPRFVINATNVQSGALWRFSKPYMWDWRVGKVASPTVSLAVAVGASSAFPPVLSPARLHLTTADFVPRTGADLQMPPYTEEVFLTDGGVYDNLGLETAWKLYKTILVSDGGGKMAPEPAPHADWMRHALRINDLIDNQVRSLRKRQVIGLFKAQQRTGAYWSVRSHVADYHLDDVMDCPPEKALPLANLPTRLAEVDDVAQERLINWAYAICDTAMRKHVVTAAGRGAFPYPDGLG